MLDWYNVLESTLASLGILQKEDHDHVYSFCPAVVNFGAASRQDKADADDEEDVFATVGDAEMQEKIKRKESVDNAALTIPSNLMSTSSTTDPDVSSDYSGDFMDSDFWQKNKKIEIKSLLSCDDGARKNKPTPAVRKSLSEINNNKSAIRKGMNANSIEEGSDDDDATNDYIQIKHPAADSSIASSNSHGNCGKEKNGIQIVDLPSECNAQYLGNSRCGVDDASCKESCHQEQTITQNENFYSEFPGKLQSSVSGHLSESLSNDTCVKEVTSSESAWETFDDDIPCISAAFGSDNPTSSDSCFLRNKLRHSTGSRKSSTSEKHGTADSQIFRHSLSPVSNVEPPLPPRIDSLPKRSHTVIDRTKNLSYGRPMFSNCRVTDANPAPPLPPRRIDSFEGEHGPPPLPSRNFQSSVKTSQNKSSDPPDLPNRPYSIRSRSSESEGATAMRPERQLSMKMKLDRSCAFNIVSLKQSQVEILQEDMATKSIVVSLTPKTCHGLAFVDVYGLVWIAGWNQKDFPKLHNQFHVGDQVKTINDTTVFTAAMAMKEIKKESSSFGTINIEVQRLPHAKVLAIRRSAEGESLGFKREGGTGEIVYVDPNGLAAKNGLTAKATYVSTSDVCNWFITEINSRPVSLFFKELEIEHRLGAVGKEISLVVQPNLFINEIKRGLKKLKNYKSYIAK